MKSMGSSSEGKQKNLPVTVARLNIQQKPFKTEDKKKEACKLDELLEEFQQKSISFDDWEVFGRDNSVVDKWCLQKLEWDGLIEVKEGFKDDGISPTVNIHITKEGLFFDGYYPIYNHTIRREKMASRSQAMAYLALLASLVTLVITVWNTFKN